MADFSSYTKFINSVSWQFAVRVSELLGHGLPARFDVDSWRLGRDEFDGPTERYSAAAYALYRRKCRNKGIEPGPFEDTTPDDDE